jgi:hypothetical protein
MQQFVSTLCGSSDTGYREGGPTNSQWCRPTTAVFVDSPNGLKELLVVDSQNHVIRRVNSDGESSLFCGSPKTRGFKDGSRFASRFAAPTSIVPTDTRFDRASYIVS